MTRLLYFLLLTSPLVCLAQEDISQFLEDQLTDWRLVGAVAGVLDADAGGGATWRAKGAAGERKYQEGTPIQFEDKFALGATTFPATILLAARLVEQGVIQWDTTVNEALGGVISINPGYQSVTLEMLAQMMGSIPGVEQNWEKHWDLYDSLFSETNWNDEASRPSQRLALSATVLGDAPDQPAGTEFVASIRSSYTILGAMLETVTDQTYEDLLRTEVLTPLGMTGCGFGPPTLDTSLPPAQPWGHLTDAFGELMLPVTPSPMSTVPAASCPSSCLHCSLDDLAGLVNAYLVKDTSFLSADTWRYITANKVELGPGVSWTLGWVKYEIPFVGDIFAMAGIEGSFYYGVNLYPSSQKAHLIAINNGALPGGMRQGFAPDTIGQYLSSHFPAKEDEKEDDFSVSEDDLTVGGTWRFPPNL